MNNIMSIDVEEWFHILDLTTLPNFQEWNQLENRIEKNFTNMLEGFESDGIKATCFFLGWVAERYPHLVKRAAEAGHEIASHGYSHTLIYSQTQEQFREDITKAKKIIEDVSGQEVLGYRAPGFSITEKTPWALEELVRAGYKYDSSYFPGYRSFGGLSTSPLDPHQIKTPAGPIMEFPISAYPVFGKNICFFGGGYLRLFPYWLIKKMMKKVHRAGRPVNVYIHPREIDPTHPRIPMNPKRKFQTYVNLKTTKGKLDSLGDDFEFTNFKAWFNDNAQKLEIAQ